MTSTPPPISPAEPGPVPTPVTGTAPPGAAPGPATTPARRTVLDMFDLTGRVAVVTGANAGIGRALARALGEAGATVVVAARTESRNTETVQELTAAGIQAMAVRTDVTVRSDVVDLTTAVMDTYGRVDVLVNDAGMCIHAPTDEVSEDDWDAVISLNLSAVWRCCQLLGAPMRAAGKGAIVNIGSMSGVIVNRPQWQAAYNASKAGVHHLTRSLATEWATDGVRVNALAPGYVRTDMTPLHDPRYRARWIDDAPMQRAAEVDELGPAALFLASDASSFVTGEVLVVDGGYTAV